MGSFPRRCTQLHLKYVFLHRDRNKEKMIAFTLIMQSSVQTKEN
jgi:hypothetical protein